MAVKQVGVTRAGNKKAFQGLSTDAKPLPPTEKIGGMSSFYESDTSKPWIYDELNANPATTNGWWEVK